MLLTTAARGGKTKVNRQAHTPVARQADDDVQFLQQESGFFEVIYYMHGNKFIFSILKLNHVNRLLIFTLIFQVEGDFPPLTTNHTKMDQGSGMPGGSQANQCSTQVGNPGLSQQEIGKPGGSRMPPASTNDGCKRRRRRVIFSDDEDDDDDDEHPAIL